MYATLLCSILYDGVSLCNTKRFKETDAHLTGLKCRITALNEQVDPPRTQSYLRTKRGLKYRKQ